MNLGQDRLQSLVCAQEGTDHTVSGAVGRGSSSPAAGRAAGTALCPWEFTPVSLPVPQNICREAQGEMSLTPTRVTLKGWMGGSFKEPAGGKRCSVLARMKPSGYQAGEVVIKGAERHPLGFGAGKRIRAEVWWDGGCRVMKLLAEH